jgi:hypothetical protein
MPYSLLTLGNNTCIGGTFAQMTARFQRLYRGRAYVHHYTQCGGMYLDAFDTCLATVQVFLPSFWFVLNANARLC